MKRTLALLLPLALIACQDTQQPTSPAAPENLAPLLSVGPGAEAVPGQYIVVFNDQVADAPELAKRLAAAHGGELRHTYQHALRGFSGRLPQQAVEALRRHPDVALIEQDQIARIVATQTGATWGIDRTDQRNLPLSGTFTYNNTGASVNAYIVDTGILITHNDFGGRASVGYDAIGDGKNGIDCNGHGTHVAGTVGGTTWGVAKSVKLIAVRVLDCGGSGSYSQVIAGVDWVTAQKNANKSQAMVANMSLGGSPSTSLDNAVNNSINAGVTYTLAAGNGNIFGIAQDACNYSPARVTNGLTVSATDSGDKKASFANFGKCVDIFAPGVSITSAYYTTTTATASLSGTSMAAPHAAGVAALYLQSNSGATPSQVASALISKATSGVVKNPGKNSPNKLLFTDY